MFKFRFVEHLSLKSVGASIARPRGFVSQNRIAIRRSSVISYGNPTIAGQLLGGRVAERSGYFDIHACRWQAYNDLSMVAPTSANDSLFDKSEFSAGTKKSGKFRKRVIKLF